MTKLAIVGLSYPYRGGIAHYSTLLVRNLRARHEVDFVTFSRQYPGFLFPGKTQYDTSSDPIVERNEAMIDSVNPLSWWRTARHLEKLKPDLIVFNWWHPFFAFAYGTIVRLLSPAMRARVCFLCHNVVSHERRWIERLLCAYAFRPVRHFIVHSESDKEILLDLDPEADVLRNCHPVYSQFSQAQRLEKAAARSRLGLDPEKKVVLFFGLIRQYKGLEYLIRAMPDVLREVDCTLLVAGEFYDDQSKYTSLVSELGLADKVRFEARYISNEDVAPYFCAADVVVLPYVEASQSGIVPIAYDFEVPVISTRVGGLPEVVLDDVTGFLVDAADPAQISRAIVRYYQGGHESRFREGIRRESGRLGCDEEIAHIEQFAARAGQGR